MNCSLSRLGLMLCVLYFCLTGLAGAIPGQITVSGRLLDKNGTPVHYYQMVSGHQVEISVYLLSQVSLYDTATAATAFSTLATTATAYNGYFSIKFDAPEAMLVKNNVWYAVSIDADQNGLTAADAFPDRFEIGAVPFALSAKPQHAFTTHGGWNLRGAGFNSMKYGTNPQNKMMVAPFETPPGGVEFNQMNLILVEAQPGNAFSFGIYDQTGKLVVSSGLITIKSASIYESFLQVRHGTIKLQPSTVYYTAQSSNASEGVLFAEGIKPVTPNFGIVDIPAANGLIPSAFDPSKVDAQTRAVAMPLSLILAPTTSKPESDWIGKPGSPQYRWIIPNITETKKK